MFAATQEPQLSGTVPQYNSTDENFKNQVSQALALKLNLKTQQHANEKMFRSLSGSGGRCLTLKQALEARAAVYDEAADPSWFVKGCDIGAKARNSKQRRVVRSQLIAAPLVVAQCGLQKMASLLYSGDASALEQFRLGERYTAAEMLKLLSRVPPIAVLKLFNKVKGSYLDRQFSKVAAELDFVQNVADLVSVNDQLNPS